MTEKAITKYPASLLRPVISKQKTSKKPVVPAKRKKSLVRPRVDNRTKLPDGDGSISEMEMIEEMDHYQMDEKLTFSVSDENDEEKGRGRN